MQPYSYATPTQKVEVYGKPAVYSPTYIAAPGGVYSPTYIAAPGGVVPSVANPAVVPSLTRGDALMGAPLPVTSATYTAGAATLVQAGDKEKRDIAQLTHPKRFFYDGQGAHKPQTAHTIPFGCTKDKAGNVTFPDGFLLVPGQYMKAPGKSGEVIHPDDHGTYHLPDGREVLADMSVKFTDGSRCHPNGAIDAPPMSAYDKLRLQQDPNDPAAMHAGPVGYGGKPIPEGAILLPDGRYRLKNGWLLDNKGVYTLHDGSVIVPSGEVFLPTGEQAHPHDDGAIPLSDGSLLHPDDSVRFPDGSVRMPLGEVIGDHERNLPTDGGVELEDGTIRYPDGRMVVNGKYGPVDIPAGSVKIPNDQGYEFPNGMIWCPDGHMVLPDSSTLYPDNRIQYPDGQIGFPDPDGTFPLTDGSTLLPDHSILMEDGVIIRPDGAHLFPDGSMRFADGSIKHPDGTIDLPNGDILNPDGTVVAQDGSLRFPDGKVRLSNGEMAVGSSGGIHDVPVVDWKRMPDGTLRLPNGMMKLPDGSVKLPDGSIRKPNGQVLLPHGMMATPHTDGSYSLANGALLLPDGNIKLMSGKILQLDGSIRQLDDSVLMPDGTKRAPGYPRPMLASPLFGGPHLPKGATRMADGSFELPNGCIQYPDGSLRLPDGSQRLPDGNVLLPNGQYAVEGPHGSRELADGSLLYPDGSIQHMDDSTLMPDGTLHLPDGTMKHPSGEISRSNHPSPQVVLPGFMGTPSAVYRESDLPRGSVKHNGGVYKIPNGMVFHPDGRMQLPEGSMKYPDGKVKLAGAQWTNPQADGSYMLTDESILHFDGTIQYPDGSFKYPDGSIRFPDGSVVWPDGRATQPTQDMVGVPIPGPAVHQDPAFIANQQGQTHIHQYEEEEYVTPPPPPPAAIGILDDSEQPPAIESAPAEDWSGLSEKERKKKEKEKKKADKAAAKAKKKEDKAAAKAAGEKKKLFGKKAAAPAAAATAGTAAGAAAAVGFANGIKKNADGTYTCPDGSIYDAKENKVTDLHGSVITQTDGRWALTDGTLLAHDLSLYHRNGVTTFRDGSVRAPEGSIRQAPPSINTMRKPDGTTMEPQFIKKGEPAATGPLFLLTDGTQFLPDLSVRGQDRVITRLDGTRLRPSIGADVKWLDDGMGGRDNVCVVDGTKPDSPARTAGMLPNDIIEDWAGVPLTSEATLRNEIGHTIPGEYLKLRIKRDGQMVEKTLVPTSTYTLVRPCHEVVSNTVVGGAPSPSTPGQAGPSSDLVTLGPQTHNAKRVAHNAPPLTWSYSLAQVAEKRATEVMHAGKLDHLPNFEFGESLFYWSETLSDSDAVHRAVDAWYSEKADYRPGTIGNASHFTQLVWKSTKELGMAVTHSPRGETYVAAVYDPKGNYATSVAANVEL